MMTGRVVGEGSAAALKMDPAVQRAYLGAAEVGADNVLEWLRGRRQ